MARHRRQAEQRHHGLPLGADDRAAARGREDPGAAGRPRPAGHGPRRQGRAPRRGGRPSLEAPRGTLFHHYRVDENDQVDDGQPDRLDDQQQRADEPGGAAGRRGLPRRQAGDHRGPAQPRRGGASAPTIPACPARRTPWARCRWRSSCATPRRPASTGSGRHEPGRRRAPGDRLRQPGPPGRRPGPGLRRRHRGAGAARRAGRDRTTS